MMNPNEKILFVDDDPNILSGFQRILRARFQVETAPGGAIAIQKLNADPHFAVIVSDYRMPEMNGVEFLAQVAQLRPDSVRILLTGEADTKAAGAAVNQGQIFRFLLKPCPVLILEKNLLSALQQFRLMQGEKDLLEQTLRGSMEVLIDLLSLVQPHAIGKSLSLYTTIKSLLDDQKLPNKWEFEIAGLLSTIGYATVPREILEKVRYGNTLSATEQNLYSSHSAIASRFLSKIPRLELVSAIIATQGNPLPGIPTWQSIDQMDRLALGAHFLDFALRWEVFRLSNLPIATLCQELTSLSYPTALIKIIERLPIPEPHSPSRLVKSSELSAGMKLQSNVISEDGLLLVAKGQVLSETIVECLRRRQEYSGTDESFSVEISSSSS